MTITITFNDLRLKAALNRFGRSIRAPRAFYRAAGLHMMQYVRSTITRQGRKRPYKPLSDWTRRRTGRRKALITLRKRIKTTSNRSGATVFFDPVSSNWNITMHHKGFKSRAVLNKTMVIPTVGGKSIVLKSRKAVRIPAREVWPTKTEVINEITPIMVRFLNKRARRDWR